MFYYALYLNFIRESYPEYCPFGKSWLSKPVTSNVREIPYVPCSNAVSPSIQTIPHLISELSRDIVIHLLDCVSAEMDMKDELVRDVSAFLFFKTTAIFDDQPASPVVACPKLGFMKSNKYGSLEILPSGGAMASSAYDITTTNVLPCSGHGICKSLRDASNDFDG